MEAAISSRVWADSNLTSSEKMVLLALDHLGDRDGFSWNGYKKLSEVTGINLESKHLTRIINKLEKDGYILIWRQHGHRGGRGYTHIYWPIVGRTDEEILEIVTRRFAATPDESKAIISQSGLLYKSLVKDNRISGDKLEQTRYIKKGVLGTPSNDKGCDKNTVSKENSVPETPINEAEDKKGVPGTPRLLESSESKESNPNKESERERESHTRKLKRIGEVDYLNQNRLFAMKLSEICGNPGPEYVVKDDRKKLAEATAQLLDWDATTEQLTDFRQKWKYDDDPWLSQVVGQWGRYLTAKKRPQNGVSHGTYQRGNQQLTGESLEGTETFDPNTGETVYPDGTRIPDTG